MTDAVRTGTSQKRRRAQSRADAAARDKTIAETVSNLTDELTRTERRIAQLFFIPVSAPWPRNAGALRGGGARKSETWPTHLLDVGKRHIVIVFDFRRYQQDVFRFAEAAASQGASIIVFTDEWMSGISRFAHHVVMAPVTVPSLYDSSVAALAQMETLIGALGLRLSKAAKKRIEGLEKLREHTVRRPRQS